MIYCGAWTDNKKWKEIEVASDFSVYPCCKLHASHQLNNTYFDKRLDAMDKDWNNLKEMDFKQIFKKNRRIINLQYGDVKSDIKAIKDENCIIYSFDKINLFNDLDGCMSILKNIDVFVTVSNSTAHIAAAMGIKTILICPKKSSTYFYWSNEETSTPWYKDVTILKVDKSIKETINKVDKILENI